MADITSSSSSSTVFGRVSGALLRFVDRVAEFQWLNASMNRRLEEVERLQALSDEDLAKQGLTRDDIVKHVFRDLIAV